MASGVNVTTFAVSDYNLAATLESGQSFRWSKVGEDWEGVIGQHWVRLREANGILTAETATYCEDWRWLTEYLQLEANLAAILKTFPQDAPMREAVAYCHGLRLLRQDPWECLGSFILSSTKQIVQIRGIVRLLCERFGTCIPSLIPGERRHAFPSPGRLACITEADLRACGMGFRAPYLQETARCVAQGELDLTALGNQPLDKARAELMQLPGVGRKIADCVLLFAYGFQAAFPVDVWVIKALRELYFPGRSVSVNRLHRFSREHFGVWAGYAQQYLFHYARTSPVLRRPRRAPRPSKLSHGDVQGCREF